MKVIFTPCAQNTVIRPMAQAVCLANGGKPTEYVDTADHKTKTITLDQLSFINLKTKVGNRNVDVEAELVAMRAHHEPVQVQVNVNDVEVIVNPDTTVEQAMKQFHDKLNQQSCVAHKTPTKRSRTNQHIR